MTAWPGLPAGLQMEVGSPFAWLCQAPQRLVVPQRMPGAPRIWTLPKAKLDPLARGLKVTTPCGALLSDTLWCTKPAAMPLVHVLYSPRISK